MKNDDIYKFDFEVFIKKIVEKNKVVLFGFFWNLFIENFFFVGFSSVIKINLVMWSGNIVGDNFY